MNKLDEVLLPTPPEGWREDWRRAISGIDCVMYVNAYGLNVGATYEERGPDGKPYIHVSMSRATARPSDVDIADALNTLFPKYRATPRLIEQRFRLHPFTVHVQVPIP